MPNDSAHNEPKNIDSPILVAVALRRDILNSSHRYAVVISAIEMVEVSDARNSRRKNNVAQNDPPVMLANIDGNTSNTSLGPASGCCPNVNTAGKIIILASIATNVSRPAVISDVRSRGVSLLK